MSENSSRSFQQIFALILVHSASSQRHVRSTTFFVLFFFFSMLKTHENKIEPPTRHLGHLKVIEVLFQLKPDGISTRVLLLELLGKYAVGLGWIERCEKFRKIIGTSLSELNELLRKFWEIKEHQSKGIEYTNLWRFQRHLHLLGTAQTRNNR